MPPLVVLGGPTATGKTPLAIQLAEDLAARGRPAEIVSADSRQVYRGLDIGTAKATAEERRRARHHGVDLVDPDEPFSVADFRTHALASLADLGSRGGVGILAGGTGFWIRAVARGIDTDGLPSDPGLRAALETALERDGLGSLVDELTRVAPDRAASIDLANPRRVVRALEITHLAGDAPLPPPVGYEAPILWLALDVEPAEHRRRIAQRARAQFDAGLIDEAESLRRRFDPNLPAFSAIGYREAWAVLDGEITREEAIDLDAARNVAFAKRQRTWFRAEGEIRWLDATDDPLPAARALLDEFLSAADEATV
ncbi:MAG: tRNA (adenosine(37)-N6)-dimethylallyltransferase MiaA [Chloroflexota bacterium]